MTSTIKKGDFVSIDYTGKFGDTTFDTTDEQMAKKIGIFNPNMKYGPLTLCVGERHIIEGIDESLEGKKIESSYSIDLPPEKAFGKKDAKMIRLIPMSVFKKQNMDPKPGMQVNIDNQIALVKRVGGGRVLVDFNHPLSGKEVHYKIKVHKHVRDPKKQLGAILLREMQIPDSVYKVQFSDNGVKLTFEKIPIPEQMQEQIKDRIMKCVPSVKKVTIHLTKLEKQE